MILLTRGPPKSKDLWSGKSDQFVLADESEKKGCFSTGIICYITPPASMEQGEGENDVKQTDLRKLIKSGESETVALCAIMSETLPT